MTEGSPPELYVLSDMLELNYIMIMFVELIS